MSLEETNGHQFTTFIQTIRKPKDKNDSYTMRKIQKDRQKHLHWINTVLKYKEIIIEYKLDDEIKKEIVSIQPYSDNPKPFPHTELTKEIIHDEEVFEDQYIRVYRSPDNQPLAIHIDSVLQWTTYSLGLNEVDAEYKKTMYV